MSWLEPGRTCWRKERADRVSVLIDADAYFVALREAIAAAQHTVYVVGWDVDTRTRLSTEPTPDGLPATLLEFLNAVLLRNRDLSVHVLAWDFSVIYALERELLPSYKFATQAHPRLTFALDDRHQVGASHHQKLVVIDDRLAFCGGIDLTIRRWDTSRHAADDPERCDPGGEPYAPMHDVQLAVDGEAARALSELVRQRWRRATGQQLGRVVLDAQACARDLWPASMGVDLTDVVVGVLRTEPSATEKHRDVREIRESILRAVTGARETVFLEQQYLTSAAVGAQLEARLREADGPEVVVILPKFECGWLEQSSMGVLRERMLRRLHQADAHGRLHAYFPVVAGLGDEWVNVHSKVLIVDDRFLLVGSANLSNRSLGLDTECDLAIDASDAPEPERTARAIARVRHRLLGEHLGLSVPQLEAELATHGGLSQTIDALSDRPRCLARLPLEHDALVNLAALEQFVVDPERPMAADAFINGLMPHRLRRPLYRSLLALAIMLLPLSLFMIGSHSGFLGGSSLAPGLSEVFAAVRQSQHALLYLVLFFALLSFVLCPVTLLWSFAVLALGPLRGGLYALVASLVSAALSYVLGRMVGRGALRYLSGPRISKLRANLRRHAFGATLAARLLPLGNFTVINLLAGALYVPFAAFFAASLLGLAPGIVGLSVFAEQLHIALREPSLSNVLLSCACGLALWGVLWLSAHLLGEAGEKRFGRPRTPRFRRSRMERASP